MKQYNTNQLKNITLAGHSNSGKTSVAEAICFNAKATNRLGNIADGTTICDYQPEEHKRNISITASIASVEYKNNKFNLIDTPGFPDFYGEVAKTIAISDNVAVVINGAEGVEATSEKLWENLDEQSKHTARFFIINKMDTERANYETALSSIQDLLTKKIVPVLVPIGAEASFKGVVNLLTNKAYTYDDGNVTEGEIPADMADMVENFRSELIENVAEVEDELMEKYLEEGELTDDEILDGFKKGFATGAIHPVVCCSSTANIGVTEIMDFVAKYVPTPNEFDNFKVTDMKSNEEIEKSYDENGPVIAQVFKCMSEQHVGELTYIKLFSGSFEAGSSLMNVESENEERFGSIFTLLGKEKVELKKVCAGDIFIAVKLKSTKTGDTLAQGKNTFKMPEIKFPPTVIAAGVVPRTKSDQEKCGVVLNKIVSEDPTLRTELKPEFAQLVIHGMGEIHLNILVEKLKQNNVNVDLVPPKISYRETIKKQVDTQKKHKKQSGGRGQYGHVVMRMEPMYPSEERYEFGNELFGGAIPAKYVPAIEKGVVEAMDKGIRAGYPVVNVKTVICDGSFHDVDSSDMAFKIASSIAFRDGALKADPIMLEPIMEVEITVPDEYMGDIMGDVSGRRGKILGSEAKGKKQIIRAHIPEAEMYQYINTLRSMTKGRGEYIMKFAQYEQVPSNVADELAAEYEKSRTEEE